MKVEDEYLGDGVYASFDGYHVILDLRGQEPAPRSAIALEPKVLANLEKYVAKCRGGCSHCGSTAGTKDECGWIVCVACGAKVGGE